MLELQAKMLALSKLEQMSAILALLKLVDNNATLAMFGILLTLRLHLIQSVSILLEILHATKIPELLK